MHITRSTRVSVLALMSALCAGQAFAHTVTLPQIDVGGKSRRVAVPHRHPAPATHPVTAARPSSPVVAAVNRSPVRAPAAASSVATPPAPENNSFGSSALQNTSLGPRIDYPAPPKEMPSSSERFFTGGQVNSIPVFRPGEALEVVPGLAVTQHSGEGKANQYYLRGFDLDHGTDLALYLDSMPLNMRTHGHGQGYADANFIMPEMLAYIDARKGPYNVEDGDFSNAGTIRMQYLQKVPEGVFQSTGGEFGYGRQFGMKSWAYEGGDILGGAEASVYNGPWLTPMKMRKINGVLRWSKGDENDGMSITGMAYANRWYSSDQIPLRAVESDQMSRWGTINPSSGGDTTRFSLSGRWAQDTGTHATKIEAFAMHSTLNLFNDFTYNLVYPVLGDQFRQFDRRTMAGGNAYHIVRSDFLGKQSEFKVGLQSRYDDIRLGLQDSYLRGPTNTVRNDHVSEGNFSLLTDFRTKWSPWLKTVVGARWDYYWGSNNGLQTYLQSPVVGVDMDPGANMFQNAFRLWTSPFNNGAAVGNLISPKASVIINPWDDKTDFYMNFGRGFHSNDFRATTQRFSTNEVTEEYGYVPIEKQGLLSPSTGAEVGVKTKAVENLESAATLFFIQTEQELVFAGDSGNTEIARGARRIGVEFTNHYRPLSWLAFEGDLTATHARFKGWDQGQADLYGELLQPDAIPWGTFFGNSPGNYLINATPIVATAVLELGEASGWFSTLKYRYIAPRALTADGFLTSPAIGTVNGRIGYRWKEGWKLQLDVFNLLNSRSQQIAYGYGSMIPTDAVYRACNGQSGATAPDAVCGVGQMGVVGHPVEPPSWRLTFGGPLNYATAVNTPPNLTEPVTSVVTSAAPVVAKWGGLYFGLNAGGGSSNYTNGAGIWYLDALNGGFSQNANTNSTSGGFIAGGQAGYNYELSPRVVVGVETDFQGTTVGTAGSGPGYAFVANVGTPDGFRYVPGYLNGATRINWFGTARGRGGYAVTPDLLAYGTGGLAYTQVQRPEGLQTSNLQAGWTAGGGLEWMFRSGWSAKAEYLYSSTYGGAPGIGGNFGIVASTDATNNTRWSTIRAGANYHLNFDEAQPVIAKY